MLEPDHIHENIQSDLAPIIDMASLFVGIGVRCFGLGMQRWLSMEELFVTLRGHRSAKARKECSKKQTCSRLDTHVQELVNYEVGGWRKTKLVRAAALHPATTARIIQLDSPSSRQRYMTPSYLLGSLSSQHECFSPVKELFWVWV